MFESVGNWTLICQMARTWPDRLDSWSVVNRRYDGATMSMTACLSSREQDKHCTFIHSTRVPFLFSLVSSDAGLRKCLCFVSPLERFSLDD